MTKIHNPFRDTPGYDCFGCAPHNTNGLAMEFYEDGDELVSFWHPRAEFSGFSGVLHGGVQATLMDEIASWTLFVKLGTAGVTKALSVEYKRTAPIEPGPVELRARIETTTKKEAAVSVRCGRSQEEPYSCGTVIYALFSPELAKKRLAYPGREAFFVGESP